MSRFGQFPGQFDALGFAAGKGGGRLAQLDIAQAHIHEGVQNVPDFAVIGKQLPGLANRQIQHIGDGVALDGHFEGGVVESPAPADFAGHEDIGQKMHLHPDIAVSAAGFATAALDVEGKTAFLVAARLGFGQQGKQVPDVIEDLGVGGRIAAGGAADGLLVDVDHLVEMGEPLDASWRPTSRWALCSLRARAG